VALDNVLRRELGSYPTPLVRLGRLSLEVGRDIFVKRDDSLGPAAGGNKTRKLEYLLADALGKGATRVATVGGAQSNHCRVTAGAARLLSLEPHVLLFGNRPDRAKGNLLIDELLGAELHFIPPGPIAGEACTFEELDAYVREEASTRIGDHYHIPLGGSNGLGTLGYVRAALEIAGQAEDIGIADARIVLAAGSGGTLAGLLAGLRLIESPLRPVGIDVGNFWCDFPGLVVRLANEACRLLGSPERIQTSDVELIEKKYVGRKYGAPTPESEGAIRRLVRLEGILLDPTYTAKAFAGLLDLVHTGDLGDDEPIIFWHTGGLPGLFA
jgi:D-cysteine desulfhydrase family pyridoxal phosphate-dependent enzyme